MLNDKYSVYDMDGSFICRLSDKLAIAKGISDDTLYEIRMYHVIRHQVEQHIKYLVDNDFDQLQIEESYKLWVDVQFSLQDAWGFPKDAKFHRSWTIPGCLCPKMDNEDTHPSQYRTVNPKCKIHGIFKRY